MDSAQRATLVLERDMEEDRWFVVAYLVHDDGRRERTTLTWRKTREEAANALEDIWAAVIKQRAKFAA